MSEQPKALQLANRLSGHGGLTFVEMHAAAAELRRLHAARERDNMSFKQLLSQRNALLEALRELLLECYDTERDDAIIAAVAKVRAAIAKAEGEKV